MDVAKSEQWVCQSWRGLGEEWWIKSMQSIRRTKARTIYLQHRRRHFVSQDQLKEMIDSKVRVGALIMRTCRRFLQSVGHWLWWKLQRPHPAAYRRRSGKSIEKRQNSTVKDSMWHLYKALTLSVTRSVDWFPTCQRTLHAIKAA